MDTEQTTILNYRILASISWNSNKWADHSTNSFIRHNGDIYIETYHVEPVSTVKTGVLSITNLMTVCANHHRQLHYGNVHLTENTEKYFAFIIDEQKINIENINIS